MIIDKEKQPENQIQSEEVFLYKPYNMLSYKSKIPELMFIQDKINNLDKYMKYMQSPVKIVPFYLPLHYKSIQSQGEQDKQYWNEIAIEFLKK